MSILFSGNSYFQSAADKLPLVQSAKTVCFWANIGDVTNLQTIFNATNSTLGSGYQLGVRNGLMTVWSYGGTSLITASITAASWVHYAYTYDGTNHALVINGVQASTTASATQSGQPLLCQIGSNQWNEYSRNTQVEDLRVYSRVLTNNEIVSIMNSSMRDSIVHGLVAHWTCSELVEGQVLIASDFEDYYGAVSTLIGTTPYPVAQASRFLQRRTI